jgi:RNA polymerase sigma factor (sigma-70 family)
MTTAEYNETVGLYANRLLRFVIKTMGDATEAEDIVQNSFEVLWKNIESVEVEKAKSYLFTIAHRRSIDHIRKHKRITLIDEPPPQAAGFATDESARTELQEHLHRALATLSEVQRSAILLRDYEGFSYQEVGEQLNITESQVKVYIFRARQKLQVLLQEVRFQ